MWPVLAVASCSLQFAANRQGLRLSGNLIVKVSSSPLVQLRLPTSRTSRCSSSLSPTRSSLKAAPDPFTYESQSGYVIDTMSDGKKLSCEDGSLLGKFHLDGIPLAYRRHVDESKCSSFEYHCSFAFVNHSIAVVPQYHKCSNML